MILPQTIRNPRISRGQPSGLGGQHAASVGTSTIHETPEQWGRRINYSRECDGLSPLSDDVLARYEAHVRHGRTLHAARLEQQVMAAAFEVSPW